ALRDRNFEATFSFGEGEGKPLPPRTVRVRIERLLPRSLHAVVSYGVMALYFGWLTSRRRGQTLGKRLLGIRVVRLDGHRLSFVESVERFVGYLHIPGSLGLALLDLWREPN